MIMEDETFTWKNLEEIPIKGVNHNDGERVRESIKRTKKKI